MVLDRKWISRSAVLALATLAGPMVAFAAEPALLQLIHSSHPAASRQAVIQQRSVTVAQAKTQQHVRVRCSERQANHDPIQPGWPKTQRSGVDGGLWRERQRHLQSQGPPERLSG